jgi:protein gp37
MTTKIQWCDETINPIVGCTKISDGCKNCYAEKMAWRLKNIGIGKYQDVVNENGWTGKICVDIDVFDKLPKYKSKKVFVCSMGDIFHKNVTENQINQVTKMMVHPMSGMSHHTYILLTKRPDRIPVSSYERFSEWKNVWLGVTVENQKSDERIEQLLKVPATVRFLSVEPMLESINIVNQLHTGKINWVICGPETGQKKRPFDLNWARFLRDQCRTAGVPFFYKKHDDPATPKDLRIKEFPKQTIKE